MTFPLLCVSSIQANCPSGELVCGLLLFESQRSLLSLPRAGLQALFIFPLGIAYAFRLTFFALAASFAEHLLKLSRAAMRRAASAAPGVCIAYTNETETYAASNQRC
jgi:hypothetical protein